MSEDTALYMGKIKKAAMMLLFQKHRKPGVKGWELRRVLGKNYLKIVNLLNLELKKIGLKVKIVSDEGEVEGKLSEDQLERAWFFVTLTDGLTITDSSMSGWRIDDLAVLAVAIAYITLKHGKASRSDVVKLLNEKLPEWKVDFNLDRFVRMGYLTQDENDVLHVGWRARAEVDQKTLLELVLVEEIKST